ncbi:MAG TPA: hypothetical protein VJ692_06280 [Nitrospiraceae bacterium]|nr:hypothetical protein [Nitrospiraceae bacterium]
MNPHPRHAITARRIGALVSLTVVVLLLVLAPFASALEVHHALAAADCDGHQHSDFDLCQWVQHHAGVSLLVSAPAISFRIPTGHYDFQNPILFISVRLSPTGPSRAPPLS